MPMKISYPVLFSSLRGLICLRRGFLDFLDCVVQTRPFLLSRAAARVVFGHPKG